MEENRNKCYFCISKQTYLITKNMAYFHQFTPSELDHMVADNASGHIEKEAGQEVEPCPQLLFLLAKSLYEQGMLSPRVHAQKLGLTVEELRHVMKPLTGMNYTQFSEEFIQLMIRDIVGGGLPWGEVNKKAQRLGFSPSGLYRFMQRRMKRTPSGRRWY